jgi:hypothetical protein
MTDVGYLPAPLVSRPAPWRVAVTTVVALLGPPAAAFVTFAASITWTGCFIECNIDHRPNHPVGALLYLLAIALLLAGPVLAGWLLRSRTAVALAVAVPVLLAAYFFVL